MKGILEKKNHEPTGKQIELLTRQRFEPELLRLQWQSCREEQAESLSRERSSQIVHLYSISF